MAVAVDSCSWSSVCRMLQYGMGVVVLLMQLWLSLVSLPLQWLCAPLCDRAPSISPSASNSTVRSHTERMLYHTTLRI